MERINEYKKLDKASLLKSVLDMKSELLGLRFTFSVAGTEKPHRIKVLKKNIARLMTVYNSKFRN